MKKLLLFALPFTLIPFSAFAWEGFDADTTNIVEVTPEKLPNKGEEIFVREFETDSQFICTVENVRRNKRTIELTARCPGDKIRTLVMDGL